MGPIVTLEVGWVGKNIKFTKFYTLKLAKYEAYFEFIPSTNLFYLLGLYKFKKAYSLMDVDRVSLTYSCRSHWNKLPQFHSPIWPLFAPPPTFSVAYHDKPWSVFFSKTGPIYMFANQTDFELQSMLCINIRTAQN